MEKEILKEVRKIVFIIASVILLLVYSETVIGALENVIDVFTPFFAGLAIAFVLNIPMAVIEKKLMSKWNGKITAKFKRAISMILSVLIVIGVVTFVVVAVTPQLKDTITDIGTRAPEFSNQMIEFVDDLTKDHPEINEWIQKIGLEKIDISEITNGFVKILQNGVVGNIVSSTVNVASSIASFLIKAIIAICFAIYLLVSKEKLLRNVKTVFVTYMPSETYRKINYFMTVLSDNFRKFIAGQCVEAVVLGMIFAVAMTLFRMPYVFLISTLIAFTALIPIAGAFIGCFIGAFLILMVSPIKMIEFLILFIVLQQLENKLVYPRIVGSSVGLPAIWVFMAVTVGGSLMGVMGMLVFIPIASTLYNLLREDIIKRTKEKREAGEELDDEILYKLKNEEDIDLEQVKENETDK